MDVDSFTAYDLELLQHAGDPGQRSHGMTLNDSHDAGAVTTGSSRAQQPPPLVLPQLQNPPLSTPRAASASNPDFISVGTSGEQHQQPLLIQVPSANGRQPLEAARSNSNNSSTPNQQAQSQAQMEAGVPPAAEDKARYDAARKELIQALQKKRAVDRTLAHLEVQIYNFEGSYLSETAAHSGGNIIQGFDGYLKAQPNRRKNEITEADRVFSNSSLTYQKSLELVMDNEEQQHNNNSNAFGGGGGGFADDATLALSNSALGISAASSTGASGRGLTPGLTTVVLPPPSTRGPSEHTPMTAAQQKKARDKEYQRRKRANAAHMRSQQQAQAHRDSVGFGREYSTDGGGDDGGSVSARGSSRRPNKRSRPLDDE